MTKWTNFFWCYISTNAVCSNYLGICSLSQILFMSFVDVAWQNLVNYVTSGSAPTLQDSVVGNRKMKFFPSRHRPTAAGTDPVGDTTFIPGSGQSSCVLSLIHDIWAEKGTAKHQCICDTILYVHLCGCSGVYSCYLHTKDHVISQDVHINKNVLNFQP